MSDRKRVDELLPEKGTNSPDSGKKKKRPPRDSGSNFGRALRSVYDDTVREEIPQDFLDLLGKLD